MSHIEVSLRNEGSVVIEKPTVILDIRKEGGRLDTRRQNPASGGRMNV